MKEKRYVPLEKQSKRRQRARYAERRGDWNGIVPVTRVVPGRRHPDRKRDRIPDPEE